MKVRMKNDPKHKIFASRFNIHALTEVIGCGVESGCNLFFIKDLEVWIKALKRWKDMQEAFKDKDLITDNINVCFFGPANEEKRKRGYRL